MKKRNIKTGMGFLRIALPCYRSSYLEDSFTYERFYENQAENKQEGFHILGLFN